MADSKKLYLSSLSTFSRNKESCLVGLTVKGPTSSLKAFKIESLLNSTVLTSPVSTRLMDAKYFSLTSITCFKESVLKLSSVACFFNLAEEYPGIYSLNGVKAIKKIVPDTRRMLLKETITNTFKRVNLIAKRSSKVSSLSTTKRYL